MLRYCPETIQHAVERQVCPAASATYFIGVLRLLLRPAHDNCLLRLLVQLLLPLTKLLCDAVDR